MITQPSPIHYLLKLLSNFPPSISNLSGHGTSLILKLNQTSFSGCRCYSIAPDVSYPLASYYLQLLQGGDISLVEYRRYCKNFGVDPIKAIHKSLVLEWFQIKKEEEDGMIESHDDEEIPEKKLKHVLKDIKIRKSKDIFLKKRKVTEKDKLKQKKERKKFRKEKTPITHEELVKNLSQVVTKRTQSVCKKSNINSNKYVNNVHIGPELRIVADTHESKNGISTKTNINIASSLLFTEPVLSFSEKEEQKEILTCLSSNGFELDSITPNTLELDRRIVQSIMANETPVGNSSSILQCHDPLLSSSRFFFNTPNSSALHNKASIPYQRDFTRILQHYNTVMKSSNKSSNSNKLSSKTTKSSSSKSKYKYLGPHPKISKQVCGNPIIILPNSLTSPITLLNVESFLVNSTYVSREALKQSTPRAKKPTSLIITRPIPSHYGTGTVDYEVMDNPIGKLHTPQDWERIVCVVAHGAEWQFKGWILPPENDRKYGNNTFSYEAKPVRVFSNSFGFYFGFEGVPIPPEVKGWNVKKGILSREKRGLDSMVATSFWKGLEDWIILHKPEFLGTLVK